MSSPRDEDDDDGRAVWDAMRQRSMEKRAANRQQSAELLERAHVKYISRNLGAHLTVTHGGRIVYFWPGTGKWFDRAGPKGRGVFKLLKHLGVSL